MVKAKMNDLGVTEKHHNVALAALLSSNNDGTIDWDRFMHFGGYSTLVSAKSTMSKTKAEIRRLLDAAGDPGTPSTKRKADVPGGSGKKRGRPAGGGKKTKDLEMDDEDDEEPEALGINKEGADADEQVKIKQEEAARITGLNVSYRTVKTADGGEVVKIEDDEWA